MPQPAQLKSFSLFYQRLRTRWLFDRRRSIKLMCVMCESPRELVTHVSHHIPNLRASRHNANFNFGRASQHHANFNDYECVRSKRNFHL
jgi:hypothetical protein